MITSFEKRSRPKAITAAAATRSRGMEEFLEVKAIAGVVVS